MDERQALIVARNHADARKWALDNHYPPSRWTFVKDFRDLQARNTKEWRLVEVPGWWRARKFSGKVDMMELEIKMFREGR